jgi:hypothetical protein
MTKPLQRKHLYVLLASTLLSLVFVCCMRNEVNDQGELFIKVNDAPSPYQEINITVDRVSVHQSGAAPDIGWTVVTTGSLGPFDLQNLRNGRSVQLVLNKVPVGSYDQIKINYGAGSILKNGVSSSLGLDESVRFGQTTSFSFRIVVGEQMQLTLHYDLVNSVIESGGPTYTFKPALEVKNTQLSGWITGSLRDSTNAVAIATIKTYTGLDTVSTINEYPYGTFQLSDLPEGTSYVVVILPDDTLLAVDTISHLTVTRLQGTNLGLIHLTHK